MKEDLESRNESLWGLNPFFLRCIHADPRSLQPCNGKANTLSTGKRDPWLVAFANNEDVGEPSGKAVAIGIFHMNYIKGTWVSLPVASARNSERSEERFLVSFDRFWGKLTLFGEFHYPVALFLVIKSLAASWGVRGLSRDGSLEPEVTHLCGGD
ncbi:hypothetical protein Celaphus_00014251 [Cervus elaphus hippelaphus]|uniref:Uncharacterized protein n=1 Tax=Cervus elaphus hippelaphus TaxID=46360 RepID=A0A212D4C3_CEREH|nr:hypothetical protein Celaphus_00014251 [Cervus elaphus hippelaphus]